VKKLSMIDNVHQVILKVNKKDPTNIPMIDIHISCTENMLILVNYEKECGKFDYIPLTFATHWRIIIIWMSYDAQEYTYRHWFLPGCTNN